MISNSSSIDSFQTYLNDEVKGLTDSFLTDFGDKLILIWDEDGDIIYASSSFEKVIGKSAKVLKGKYWASIFKSEQLDAIPHMLKSSETQITMSNIYLKEAIEEIEFQVLFDLLVINQQTLYVCKLTNRTLENNIKSMFADLEKLILAGQLSAGLVHEIKNPLTSIKGFLQLVQAGVEQKDEYYRIIINEVNKLEKITSELLHLSKPVNGEMQQECVEHLVKDVVFILSTQLDMRKVKFVIDVEESFISYCDATQIKQVLINLMKNAAESMDKKGTIQIKITRKQDFIAIDIIDEGPGLVADKVCELQKPFYTTKKEGTGLGLIIVNYLLGMHGGYLDIIPNKTNGMTFTIMLPVHNNN